MDDFWCLLLLGNCCLPDGDDIEDHNSSGNRKKRSNHHRVVPFSSSSKAEDQQRLLPKDHGNDLDSYRPVTHKPSWTDLDCLSYLLLGSADETDGIDGRNMTTIPAVVQVETTDDGDCRDSISDIQEIRHCSVKLEKSPTQGTETNKRNSALSEAVDLWISDAYPQVKEEATILSGRSKSKRSGHGSFSFTLPERSSTGDTDKGTTPLESSSKTTSSLSKPMKRRRNSNKCTHRKEDAAVAAGARIGASSTSCRSEPKHRTLSTQYEASKAVASPHQPETSTPFTTVSSKQHAFQTEISISSAKDSLEDAARTSAPPAVIVIIDTKKKKKSKKKRKTKRSKGASSSSAASSMASSFASSCASNSKRTTSTKILSITTEDGDFIDKENMGIALSSETLDRQQRIPLTIQTKRQVLYSHV